jgi:hypothetical protein
MSYNQGRVHCDRCGKLIDAGVEAFEYVEWFTEPMDLCRECDGRFIEATLEALWKQSKRN